MKRREPSFTLVPQQDRRQEGDRRLFWRGGRRASDAFPATPIVPAELTVFWAPADEPAGSTLQGPKALLH